MYVFGILRTSVFICRSKIVDLLYDSHKNECVKSNRIFVRIITVIFSFLSVAVSGGLLAKGAALHSNDAVLFMGGAIILIMIGIYGLYRNIPFFVVNLFQEKQKEKIYRYKFVLSGTDWIQSSIGWQNDGRYGNPFDCFFSDYVHWSVGGAGYKTNIEADYPYDAEVALNAPLTKECMYSITDFVNEKCFIRDYLIYYLYAAEGYPIEALSLSDYNRLRQILDFEQVELQSDQFMIHCDTFTFVQLSPFSRGLL